MEKLSDEMDIQYMDVTYKEILAFVRDKVHLGFELKSHPLSGSVKPGETGYKSVMVSATQGQLDLESLDIIEKAIATSNKFVDNTELYDENIKKDFQLVDYTLIKSAVDMIIQK